MARQEREALYRDAMSIARTYGQKELDAAMRDLALRDLYFLLTVVLGRQDMRHDWLYARCLEVQDQPDGMLDLWARDHRKSSIITFGKTIQDVLANPEETVGIFSHTKTSARGFLVQIKNEFENNKLLHQLFPDVIYANPQKEAPLWTQEAITLKRKSNPKEATIEAWGLIEGQPIGRHYTLMIYDDVITDEECSNPEMIQKATDAWAMSTNLVSSGRCRVRYIGTRYHLYDTWGEIIKREAAIPRIHPATDTGKADGVPVFLTQAALDEKKKQGPYIFSCQQLLNPIADEDQTFRKEWKRFWHPEKDGWSRMNRYIIVDPAGSKKRKKNDYTSIFVLGLHVDNNYYVIDMVRDRLNLTERTAKVFELHKTYLPLATGYEEYGMQADIEHIKYVQEKDHYRFDITPLGGNQLSKNDRIKQLVPVFQQGRMYLPFSLNYTDMQGKAHSLVSTFFEQEYDAFPVLLHDDMLDTLARIVDPDLGAKFPKPAKAATGAAKRRRTRSAMAA